VIRVRRLVKRYGAGPPVLDRLDLALAPGELALLSGPSGSGKSTLLRVLWGEELASDGEVVVLGQSLARRTPRALRDLRRRIGILGQGSGLLPDLSVAQNVALALRVLGRDERWLAPRVTDCLERLGLLPLAERLPRSLSAGEARRVELARALVRQPELILADDPCGALEPSEAAGILTQLAAQRAQGTAVLVVGRELAPPSLMGARRLRLEQGRLRGGGAQ